MNNRTWFGLFAARGTPQAIIDKVNAQVNEILKEKDTQEALELQGATPVGGSPQDFARFMRKDYENWRPVAQRAGGSL